MASWFWDVLKVGSGEVGDFTQAEERRELRSQQEPLASGQLFAPFYTPSCPSFSSLPPASAPCLSLLNTPFVPEFLLPNYWLLVFGPHLSLLLSAQLASAGLSEFNISLGRQLLS